MKTSIIDTKVMKDKLHEYAMKVGRILRKAISC